MTQLERHQDNELAHHDSDEIAVSFHWPAPVLGSGPLPGTRERVQRILDAAPPIALLQRLAHKTVRRVRYTNDDGTPTQRWAVVNIYAPAIVVISIVVAAILEQ